MKTTDRVLPLLLLGIVIFLSSNSWAQPTPLPSNISADEEPANQPNKERAESREALKHTLKEELKKELRQELSNELNQQLNKQQSHPDESSTKKLVRENLGYVESNVISLVDRSGF